MIILLILGFMTSLIIAYFSYKSELSNIVKLLSLPLIIVYFGVAGIYYYNNLGAPIERMPPLTINYQHHIIDGEYIIVWLHDEKTGHRLYKIEYDRDTAKALEEAKKMQEAGARPKLKGSRGEAEKGARVTWKVQNLIPQSELWEAK